MQIRPRRLRKTGAIREINAETALQAKNLVLPLFIMEGKRTVSPIHSMPGVNRVTLDEARNVIMEAKEFGIRSFALFPKIDESLKTSTAEEALNPNGLVPRALQQFKNEFTDEVFITDIALDPFSSDGHDGLVKDGKILNDETVNVLAKMSVLHAKNGADIVAPSDMMDGRVAAMRKALDENNFTDISILSYAAKYCSAFYGPFRDALDSAPRAGDKKTYQMDPRNRLEAIREVQLDVTEGADIVMVKPAGAYLDIIREVKNAVNIPVAAYQVSGEYSMLQFGAQHGLFNLDRAMEESLLSIRRAGADLIFTYFAVEMAKRI